MMNKKGAGKAYEAQLWKNFKDLESSNPDIYCSDINDIESVKDLYNKFTKIKKKKNEPWEEFEELPGLRDKDTFKSSERKPNSATILKPQIGIQGRKYIVFQQVKGHNGRFPTDTEIDFLVLDLTKTRDQAILLIDAKDYKGNDCSTPNQKMMRNLFTLHSTNALFFRSRKYQAKKRNTVVGAFGKTGNLVWGRQQIIPFETKKPQLYNARIMHAIEFCFDNPIINNVRIQFDIYFPKHTEYERFNKSLQDILNILAKHKKDFSKQIYDSICKTLTQLFNHVALYGK